MDIGHIGHRIREARERRGLPQAEVARRLGIEKSTLSKYELGRRSPDYDILQKIADMFEVPMEWLLKGDDANKKFISELDLNDDELLKKYNFIFDGQILTEEEVRGVLAYLRAARSLKRGSNDGPTQ